jgi:RNA polymerase sigma-32 factor
MEPKGHSLTHSYFRDLRKHKLLGREKERSLARRIKQNDDPDALRQLINGNLRLVVQIAKSFRSGNGNSFADLIQEGNLGLVQAARKFDPSKKVKFSYYARFWIKAYIYKFLMKNHRSVRIGTTQSQRKIFYNLKKIETGLLRDGIEPTTKEISRRLNVPEEDLIEMQQRLDHPDISLNNPLRSRKNEEMIDKLTSSAVSVEEEFAKNQFSALLRKIARQIKKDLNSREKDILESRLLSGQPITLKILGNKYGVSRERIRQVEMRITEKLRVHLLKEFPDIERYFYN